MKKAQLKFRLSNLLSLNCINKNTSYILIMLAIVAMMSFKVKKELIEVKTGKYGICSCSNLNSIIIELTINKDSSFHYINNTDPKQHIDIIGKWNLQGSNLILNNYKSDFLINNKWSIDKTQNSIKSRKGLLWTSLHHIESCK